VLSKYDAVLSALSAGVVIHAADTRILEANERARVLLELQNPEGRHGSRLGLPGGRPLADDP
jgi:PAS domain-containing protein